MDEEFLEEFLGEKFGDKQYMGEKSMNENYLFDLFEDEKYINKKYGGNNSDLIIYRLQKKMEKGIDGILIFIFFENSKLYNFFVCYII